MAYDEEVAERIRAMLARRSDVNEKRMFGGLCFMLRGHMCCAVSGRGGLLVRVGPDAPSAVFKEPHASPVEMRGRTMTGFVRVAPDGYRTASGLKKWVARAVDFVATLPKKTKKAPKRKAAKMAKKK
jgi:TfoX/Sxy family transcriptional regulator of competence genes